jgi:hypothetical protein
MDLHKNKFLVGVWLFVAVVLIVSAVVFFWPSKSQNQIPVSPGNRQSCWDGTMSGDGCSAKKTSNMYTEQQRPKALSILSRLSDGAKTRKKPVYRAIINAESAPLKTKSRIETISFQINRLMTSVEEDSGATVNHAYGVDIVLELYNVDTQGKIKFHALLDTGSFDLIVQTDKSLEANIKNKPDYDDMKANGVWVTGDNCLVPDSETTISYGGGAVGTETYSAFIVDDDSNAVGLNIKAATTTGMIYNVCGMIPGNYSDPKQYGFVNYILNGLTNCVRGFVVDLKANVLTVGKVDRQGFALEMLQKDDLRKIYTYNIPEGITFYMCKLASINGIVPDAGQIVYLMFDTGNTFISVSNDYTKNLLLRAMGVKGADDRTTHSTVNIGLQNQAGEKFTLSSKTPLSLEMGASEPYYYIKLNSPFTQDFTKGYGIKINLISVGLTFQLDTAISYDLVDRIMYMRSF